MVKTITGRVSNLILNGKLEDISKEYVHYDPSDNGGFLFTQYDSNNATEWKKGSEVITTTTTEVEDIQVVIKDIPFEPIVKSNNTGSSNTGSNTTVTTTTNKTSPDVELQDSDGNKLATVEGAE